MDAAAASPLRQARERKGFSREHVTRKLESPMSAKTLERWEKEISQPPGWRLEQLAELYGVDPDALMDGHGKVAV